MLTGVPLAAGMPPASAAGAATWTAQTAPLRVVRAPQSAVYRVAGAGRPLVQQRTALGWQELPVSVAAGVSPGTVGLDAVSCAGGGCHASGSVSGSPSAGDPYHLVYATS